LGDNASETIWLHSLPLKPVAALDNPSHRPKSALPPDKARRHFVQPAANDAHLSIFYPNNISHIFALLYSHEYAHKYLLLLYQRFNPT